MYRARDTRLGRDVAIKSLPTGLAAEPERLSRFRREAQTLASLNHANIGAIYGLEEAHGAPYLVLELVEGESLAVRLSRGSLPPREALGLGIQIACAIEAAHERGIVHRDLKPGNVMITPAGAAKVLDFGLAKSDPGIAVHGELTQSPTITVQAGRTMAGAIVGTVAYMSPEQARGKPVDRRSDVWSFGCVLFECFAGRPAFTGETAFGPDRAHPGARARLERAPRAHARAGPGDPAPLPAQGRRRRGRATSATCGWSWPRSHRAERRATAGAKSRSR